MCLLSKVRHETLEFMIMKYCRSRNFMFQARSPEAASYSAAHSKCLLRSQKTPTIAISCNHWRPWQFFLILHWTCEVVNLLASFFWSTFCTHLVLTYLTILIIRRSAEFESLLVTYWLSPAICNFLSLSNCIFKSVFWTPIKCIFFPQAT